MNNELIFKGNQIFMDKEIPVIYGGFGENQKCVTAKTVAEIHGIKVKEVQALISNNLSEFDEDIDLIDLKSEYKNSVDTVNPLLFALGYNKQSIANSLHIYLLSEQGYMALVSLMRTEKAKSLRKQFRREYFLMKEKEQLEQSTQSFTPVFEDYLHKTFNFKSQDVEVLKIDDQLLFNFYHIGKCLDMRDETIKSFAKAIGKQQLIRFKIDDVYNYKLHSGDCFLTLSGVYRIIFISNSMTTNSTTAEQFTNWIAEEVLFNMINVPVSPVQALDVKSLEAINEAAKLILPSVEAAGMEPVHRSRLLKQLYGKAGITVPTLKIEQKNLPYTRTMIAEKLGVYSKGNNPHASAVSAILKKLIIEPTNIVLISYDKNGHTGFDYQYKAPVVEQIKQWLEQNEYPNTIYDNGRMYNVSYREAGVLA